MSPVLQINILLSKLNLIAEYARIVMQILNIARDAAALEHALNVKMDFS